MRREPPPDKSRPVLSFRQPVPSKRSPDAFAHYLQLWQMVLTAFKKKAETKEGNP